MSPAPGTSPDPSYRPLIHWSADLQLVPATLADFECEHGLIGACTDCEPLEEETYGIA